MSEEFTQDLYLSYAFDIASGKAGGEYIYSLQEDYIYSYEQGYWKRIFEIEFLDRVERKIKKITKYPLSVRKQIVENFKYKKYLRLEEFNKQPLINFENYMFDPMGNNVLNHKASYYSTIRIPYKYEALATCPLWIKTLKEILEGNDSKIRLLQEFLGYCLMPDNEQKKALLLLGETDTGKSTIIDIFRELIGDVNCSNVPLQWLSNPQYTPLLINKMVNIDPEVNKNASDYEREFKLITGGKNEKVSCNQKHIPTFEFTPKCKMILSANIFPKITDHSSAFYQRLLVIPCERRFMEHEKDRQLHDKLKVEFPGIFNWVVEGLHRLRERGRFEQYEFMTNAIVELEDENNPSNIFFKDHVDIVMGEYVEKGDLYERYKEWAFKTKNYTLNSARFSQVVHKKFHHQTPKDTHHPATNKRIWKNIKHVMFKDSSSKEDGVDTHQEIDWSLPAVAIYKTASPTTIAADSQQGDFYGR